MEIKISEWNSTLVYLIKAYQMRAEWFTYKLVWYYVIVSNFIAMFLSRIIVESFPPKPI